MMDAGATEKSLEMMRKFSEQYARGSGTYFCMDKSVTAVVIQGLAEHKEELGSPLCPCRHYDDKAAEVAQGFWNCPCVPMRERKECHCMLFLTYVLFCFVLFFASTRVRREAALDDETRLTTRCFCIVFAGRITISPVTNKPSPWMNLSNSPKICEFRARTLFVYFTTKPLLSLYTNPTFFI